MVMITSIRLLVLPVVVVLFVKTSPAYQVWISATKVPRTVISTPSVSANTRRLVDGLNLNFTPIRQIDGPFAANELAMKDEDWKAYFASLQPSARRGMSPIPRTTVFHPDLPILRSSIEEKLSNMFVPKDIGAEIGIFMPYDNYYLEDPTLGQYHWSLAEMQQVRTWLDTSNGKRFESVSVARDVRNWGMQQNGVKQEIDDGLIDAYVFEANPTAFYSNVGGRAAMLDYFFQSTDTNVQNTKVYFQIPLANWEWAAEPGASPYQMVRNFGQRLPPTTKQRRHRRGP